MITTTYKTGLKARSTVQAAFLAITVAISIYDLSHDPKRVVVEGCDGSTCARVVVLKSEIENETTLDKIAAALPSVSK